MLAKRITKMLFLGNQMLYFTCVLTQKIIPYFSRQYLITHTGTCYYVLTQFLSYSSQGEPGYKGPDGDPVCTYSSNGFFF